MNIIISINNSYVEPAKTMIFSLKENNSDCKINIFLLYNGLNKENINDFKQFICELKYVKLFLIYVDNKYFSNAPKMKWWSQEMYYRILAFELLPKDVHRALWLDSDIIINGNIRSFYDTEIKDVYAIVCKGCNQSGIKRLLLNENHIYFNSGVILFNLEKIRNDFKVSDFIECISYNKERLLTPDQDVLNILFQGNINYADEKIYNNETFGDYVLSKEKMNILKTKTKIIHFNGPTKPWDPHGVNWADKFWWRYEKKRGRFIKFLEYRIKNFPIKIKSYFRELFYIFISVLKK